MNIFGGEGYCGIDSSSSFISCQEASGAAPAETFFPISPGGSSNATAISVGQPVIWQNEATGLYCRVVEDTRGLLSIKCDQPTIQTASTFTYSPTGVRGGLGNGAR